MEVQLATAPISRQDRGSQQTCCSSWHSYDHTIIHAFATEPMHKLLLYLSFLLFVGSPVSA